VRKPVWCSAFLIALDTELGNVKRAAEMIGRSRAQVYRRRRIDPQFAEMMDTVFARVQARLERLVSRRPA